MDTIERLDHDHEGEALERDNISLREKMLEYNNLTDTADPYPVARALIQADRKVIVPVVVDPDDPDAPHRFDTMYKRGDRVDLHVYTSVTLIPAMCETDNLVFYPLLDLLNDITTYGNVHVLRIDPGTPHGVGFLFDEKGPRIFRLKRVEDLMADTGRS